MSYFGFKKKKKKKKKKCEKKKKKKKKVICHDEALSGVLAEKKRKKLGAFKQCIIRCFCLMKLGRVLAVI